jgi:ribosomal protein S18 acetylase RimI-like enzyme
MDDANISKLSGANMDIDLVSLKGQIEWDQDQCPWNLEVGKDIHHCAVKDISICLYFCGIDYLDVVKCCYPHPNPYRTQYERKIEAMIQGPIMGGASLCEPILRSLPDWFGIESANTQYLHDIDSLPTFLALQAGEPIGFLSLKEHNPYTCEIYVMGVLPEYHHQGIGHTMLTQAEAYLRNRGVEYLQVKTLSNAHPDENYARTRAFYLSHDFRPLEEFKDLWGSENPCLQMIKALS